ncbi:MAG: universal stress protein [Planctomycetota bacterium]
MAATDQILVAVDLAEQSESIIATGITVARAFQAEILLVHTVHELKPLYGVYLAEKPVSELQAEVEADARSRLLQFSAEHVRPRYASVRELLLNGVPWRAIIECAREHRVALIVVGAHVSQATEHKILGSTTDRILRHAPCPVLVVPPTP